MSNHVQMWYNTGVANQKSDRGDALTSRGLGNCVGGTATMNHHTLDASRVKTCTSCGATKPLSEYHRHRDSLRPACKACTNAQNRSIYSKHKQSHLAAKRRYRAENADARLDTTRRYEERNPDKRAAYVAVKTAIKERRLPEIHAMTCARCGKPAAVYHHHSYAPEYRLDVIALCRVCHGKEHRRYDA